MAHSPSHGSSLPQPQGHGGHHADAHSEPHASSATYFAIFIALVVLTAISFGIGMYLSSLPKWVANLAMVTVSCAKAMLVILFFMHILFEASWKYVLTIPAAGMSLFLVAMLYFEFNNHAQTYSEERWVYAAEPEVHAGAPEHGADSHGSTSKANPAEPQADHATPSATH